MFDAAFEPGDHLLFGKESAGLPDDILAMHGEWALRLPMAAGERSLNLATAVCAVVYEGIRQLLRGGHVAEDLAGNLVQPGASSDVLVQSKPKL